MIEVVRGLDKHSGRGFTLIELMTVVVIVGVLAAVAIPSYMEHLKKGKRAEVKAALLQGAQALERYYTANGTYLNAAALAAVFPTAAPSSGSANYNIAVQGNPTRNTYTLRATRAGSMAGDECGDFEVNHAGARTLANQSNRTVAQCW